MEKILRNFRVASRAVIFNKLIIIIIFMWGRIHPNLDIDLYLPLDEFEDISSLGLEKVLSCELPTLIGDYSGKKAHLQCKDFNEDDNVLKVEYRESNYFIKIAKNVPGNMDITGEKGHLGQTDGINVTLYIFERSPI